MTERLSTYLMAAGGVGLLLVALAQVPVAWWRGLAAGWPVLLPVVASLAALGAGALLRRRGAEEHEPSAAPTAPDRQVRPLRSWVIPAGVAVVGVVTTAALVWLQDSVPVVGDGVQRAQLRVESIRTALTIGAAVTGAFALLLAFRRQQLAERTQQATEYDAGEKRVTELYVKAVDQLGSDKAPVRLGGLYALERLAQDNPIHRQSIVEVICAYLRMPYTPPAGEPSPSADRLPADDGDPVSGEAETATAVSGGGDPDKPERDPREERQVRLAAQRILAAHLRPKTPEGHTNLMYWGPKIILDLTEATLLEPDFTDCRLYNVTYTNATFSGAVGFSGATFSGDARFNGATFGGDSVFSGAIFVDAAYFGGATFNGKAVFNKAKLAGAAGFSGATFGGNAFFGGATLSGNAEFDGAMFSGDAGFGGAMFSGAAAFNGAVFSGRAWFSEVVFSGEARFNNAAFNNNAGFKNTTFSDGGSFGDATFSRGAWFDGAKFSGRAWFVKATFGLNASWCQAVFSGKGAFSYATFSGGADFGEATFRDDATFHWATFSGHVIFNGAVFENVVTFLKAKFSRPPTFNDVTFPATKSFEGATINGASYAGPSPAETP